MNKRVFGKIGIPPIVRTGENNFIINYDIQKCDDNIHVTYYEIVILGIDSSVLTLDQVKDAIINDINSQTDEKILNGFDWIVACGKDVGKKVKVWLSKENQNNLKTLHDRAKEYPGMDMFPITYKISEDENGTSVYETFNDADSLSVFYLNIANYIQQTVSEGWARKDNIDWSIYEEALRNNGNN